MMVTGVRSRVEGNADRELIGRHPELDVLAQVLNDDGPLVTVIHGLAGVGKSTLLHAFVARARATGTTVIVLDGRTFEPTSGGFLAEIAHATDAPAAEIGAVTARLAEMPRPTLIALDSYENQRLIDGWLRSEFVPALSDNVRLVMAGREAPIFAWEAAPGWRGFFRSIPLGPLPPPDAISLLERD
jgi:hypothetical protein